MITTYLFDLDDTIIDSSIYRRIYSDVINAILSNVLVDKIKLQKTIDRVKKPDSDKVDTYELCNELNCIDLYYKILEKQIKHTYNIKNKSIPTIFRKIHAKDKRLGIVTQAQERTAKLFLKRFSLFEYVNFIYSGKKDTVGFWIQLSKRFDIVPDNSMVIDDCDDILDIAKHVGYKTLNVKDINQLEEFDV